MQIDALKDENCFSFLKRLYSLFVPSYFGQFFGLDLAEGIDSDLSSYNIQGMADTKNMRKKRKKKKRRLRYDPVRLGIVIVVALAIVCTACFSVYGVVNMFRSGNKEKVSETIADSSSTSSSTSGSISNTTQITASVAADPSPALVRLAAAKTTMEAMFEDNSLADLKVQINDYLTNKGIDPTKVSWAIQDLVTGETVESNNARQNFTAASTYKLPLCVYYYEEIAAGRINPSDTLVYTEEMREEEDDENLNQPIHRKYKVGDKIQIDELLEAALLYSDNIAGHMLYSNIGGYTAFKEIVAKYASVPQTSDFYIESENLINADYMMRLLKYIYETPGTFNDLKYWLQYTAYNTFLNRDVPGTYIQKIGNINEVRNAVGIYNGTPPFTLSIYSCASKKDGLDILGEVGAMVLSYFTNRYYSGVYSAYDMTPYLELNAQMSTPPDVIEDRDGPDGQKLPEMTEEQKKKMSEAIQKELGGDESSAQSSETVQPEVVPETQAPVAEPESSSSQSQTSDSAQDSSQIQSLAV